MMQIMEYEIAFMVGDEQRVTVLDDTYPMVHDCYSAIELVIKSYKITHPDQQFELVYTKEYPSKSYDHVVGYIHECPVQIM